MSLKALSAHFEPVIRAAQRRRPSRFECQHRARPTICIRCLSHTPIRHDLEESRQQARSRWANTPKFMKAPVSLKPWKPQNQWKVNESQQDLDTFYKRLLGEDGDKLLSDEVKWLAVTHKSFDQGRRGYNDRLAFLGRLYWDSGRIGIDSSDQAGAYSTCRPQ